MKKFLCLVLAILLCIACVGCGGSNEVDSDTLYVANFQGGIGRQWLDKVIEAYKKDNPNKKVEVVEKASEFSDGSLINNIDSYPYDVYFLNDITYSKYVQNGLFADMTNFVTAKQYDKNMNIVESGFGSQSIEDNMLDDFKNVYKINNEKYYAIPFFLAAYGLVYDADLFSEKQFYLKDGGGFTGVDSEKSKGRDGVVSFDDGLPSNMSEFKLLMQEMYSANITPFVWAGETSYQRIHLLEAVWAEYNGKSDFMLNYNFSGTDSVLGEINTENAYLLQKQSGKKAAAAFAKYATEDESRYYTSKTLSHTAAQEAFLSSWPRSINASTVNRAGLLVEGGFWENESRENGFFASIAKQYKNDRYEYGNRKFGYMPIPKFDDAFEAYGVPAQLNDEYNMFMFGSQSLVAISESSKKKDMAEDFLKFVQSAKGLEMFTQYSGTMRPYKYSLSEDAFNSLTYYSQSVWNAYTSEKVTKTFDLKNHTFYNNFRKDFDAWSWGSYRTADSKVSLGEPFSAFIEQPDLTVLEYYNGLTNYWTSTKWQTYMNFIQNGD